MSTMLSLLIKRLTVGLFLGAAAGVLPLLFAQEAKAQIVDQENLEITANVDKNCRIDSTTPVAFGNIDFLDSMIFNAEGSVTIKCVPKADITVSITGGNHASSGSAICNDRRMQSDDDNTVFLPYSLYQNAARTTLWGCGPAAKQFRPANATAIEYTIYGQIDIDQNTLNDLVPGDYQDTVEIQITF